MIAALSRLASSRLLLLFGALGTAVFLAGCAAEGLGVRADGCWGSGIGSDSLACLQEKAGPLGAMGFDLGSAVINASALLSAPRGGCGSLVDCSQVKVPPKKVAASKPPSSAGGGGGGSVRASAPRGSASASASSGAAATPVATSGAPSDVRSMDANSGSGASAGSGSEAVATLSPPPSTPPTVVPEAPKSTGKASPNCAGLSIEGMEKKATLSAKEASCAMDTAKGTTNASDAVVQTAAIALYNTKASGWASAVEAALGRSALSNAPPLNFAGIKPAYDKSRYGTVLQRSRKVWRNLGKGYQLTGSDKDFLVEYSCRSAGQLALSGKPPSDGIDWCERWLDRAERSGGSVDEVEDLIRQLE